MNEEIRVLVEQLHNKDRVIVSNTLTVLREKAFLVLHKADLSRVNLSGMNLYRAILSEADLSGADLSRANLSDATLSGANLSGANLSGADLTGVQLDRANLSSADLSGARLKHADLTGADFSGANLFDANLTEANLRGALLAGAHLGYTSLNDLDLSEVRGLDEVIHDGPSHIDTHTLENSQGALSENFLRGCGLSNDLIDYSKQLGEHGMDYYSCFISYSHHDRVFALRLHDTLQNKGVRCWLYEHSALNGDGPHHEASRFIRFWDKVLLCCSEVALTSWWIDDEIGTALEKEQVLTQQYGQVVRAIIPLDLDGHIHKDDYHKGYLAQLRRRLAADFQGWNSDEGKFNIGVQQVLKALRVDISVKEIPMEAKG